MSRVLAGDLEYKTVAPGYATRVSSAPKVQTKGEVGEVTFFAAVTGIQDEVGDVLVPGVFRRTLSVRKPKVCLNHQWDRPIGRTLEVKELLPGDPELPATTNTGAPWPKEAGALKVRALYNLSTPDGFASFKNAQFFPPEECQFSIGYKTRKSSRRNGIRFITDLDLYEYGPVLHAANSLAGLLSIKAIDAGDYETSDMVAWGLEEKVRFVRNPEFWGLPYGTPIKPGMKPRGPLARKLAKQGKPIRDDVGVVEVGKGDDANLALKPTAKGKLKRNDGLFEGQIIELFQDGYSPFDDDFTVEDREKINKGEEYNPLDLLVANGVLPIDVEETLRDDRWWQGVGADRLFEEDDEERQAEIDDFVRDAMDAYREKYNAALTRQNDPGDDDVEAAHAGAKPGGAAAPTSPVLQTPEAVVEHLRSRAKPRSKGISPQGRITAGKALARLAGRAPDRPVSPAEKITVDPDRVVVSPVGLTAVAPVRPELTWTIFDSSSGMTVPVNKLLERAASSVDEPEILTRERAEAFMRAMENVVDSKGNPPPLGDPRRNPEEWGKEWRDAEGRGLAQAISDVVIPAYLREVENEPEDQDEDEVGGGAQADADRRPPPATEPVPVKFADDGRPPAKGYAIPPPPDEDGVAPRPDTVVTDSETTRIAGMTRPSAARAAARMSDDELAAHDAELTRRAGALGRAGQVSPPHQAIRDELSRREWRDENGQPREAAAIGSNATGQTGDTGDNQDSAQIGAGGEDGSARGDRRAALEGTPAEGVRGAEGQDGVLRRAGGRGGAPDRGAGGDAGGRGPAGRDLPAEDGPSDDGSARRGVAGDEGVPAPGAGDDTGTGEPDRPAARRRGGAVRAGARRAGGDAAADERADDAAAVRQGDSPQPAVDNAQVANVPPDGPRFQPSGVQDLAPAGERAKLKANMEALRTLRTLQNEGRPATPAEQKVLARWAGWGSLPKVFDDTKPEYAAERAELRELMTEQEILEASRNTLNAHYTDARVTQAMWKAVQDLGFTEGRVLEPGSGSGTFIGFAPDGADMVGVELDSTTAAISRYLYPDATIRNESFADTQVPEGAFDATIGNVPYGKFALTSDRTYNPDGHSIHNHFILKSLALTRPGGLVTVLTSRYTLDGEGPKAAEARRQMAELGDLVGAVRLPNGSHQRTAGTDVIEDILIFRRREPGAPVQEDQSWITSTTRDIGGMDVAVNDYWTAHPDHILGDVGSRLDRFGKPDVVVTGDKNMPGLPDALASIVANARAEGLTATEREGAAAPELISPDRTRHEGHVQMEEDGTFTQAVGGASVAFDVPKTQAAELKSLLGLRDGLQALLDAESATAEDTPDIAALRADLNNRYDAYVTKFGPVNRFSYNANGSRNRPSQGGFRRDPMSAIVRALEDYDQVTGTATKADIFRKRAVAPRELATRADNPADALTLSMDTYGEVNLEAIADMLGVDEPTARQQLGELVFEQPPLTDAEITAAHKVDAVRMLGEISDIDTSEYAAELENVGESVREPGKLEPSAAYLSGNVRKKLAVARAAAAADPRFAANVEALEKVLPPELGPEEIDGRLGAAWIDAATVQQFLRELLEDHWGQVQVRQVGAYWSVEAPKYGNLASEVWGTPERSAGEIVQSLLEQRSIKVTRKPKGADKAIPDPEATLAAQAKAEEIQERFNEWLWEDSDRARRLQARYNDQFNSIALRSYDGAKRTFPGMATHFQPRPHQVAAVERIVNEPTALLGHVVGAGKTAEMTMGCAELKRLGMARKPCIVIPNHMLEQFSREYLEIYPNAKILAAGTKDLEGTKRREFVARAATGDWDAVILTQKAFEAIPMSSDNVSAYIDRELGEMRAQYQEARERAIESGDAAQSKTIKKMEQAIVSAEEALKKKLGKVKDVGVTWEQTGIDYLMVDEAHGYSNLRTLSNIQGAGATGSDMATDLHMKLEYLREKSESGRVATFATGTPIRNTVTQAYVMMRFLRPDLLKEAGISSFDQWAATFGSVVEEMELKPEGQGFRQTSRFAKFRNVPELLRIFHTFADIKLASDLKLPTPNLVGGKAETVTVEPSDELKQFIQELGYRAEQVRNGAVKPDEDNMLKISTDGRKAALSMALVGQEHQPGKIEAAADKISAIWRETKDKRYPIDPKNPAAGDDPVPGSLQIVFMDLGTPGDEDKWNGYDALKAELTARGMDPSTVRFIHEAKNDAQKAEMFAAARAGRISVLIGSSEKMGVGTNVQKRAVALHHLDAPWRPADVEQRDGRIMRQGNLNPDVRILRYVTEGSFDAYMWQTLERKAKFINQIMKGNLDVREIEDVGDTALSYAEVKALATGDPDLLDKAKVDSLLGKLERLARTHARTQSNLRKDSEKYLIGAAQAEADAKAFDAAIAQRTNTRGDAFRMTIGGRDFTARTDANNVLKDRLQGILRDGQYSYGRARPQVVGTIGGHTVLAVYEGKKQGHGVTLTFEGVPGEIGWLSAQEALGGNAVTRIENGLQALDTKREKLLERAVFWRDEAAKMQSRLGMEFPQQAKLDAARKKSTRLGEKMQRNARRAAGEEIEFEPHIDSDQYDDPILGKPDADVPPEAPAPVPEPAAAPVDEPVEELDDDLTVAAADLAAELDAGTLDDADLAEAAQLRDELGSTELSDEDLAAAQDLADDLSAGRITAPTPAAEPAAIANVPPNLAAGDPVPEFGSRWGAISYVAGPTGVAEEAISIYINPLTPADERSTMLDKIEDLAESPAVIDGVTVLAVSHDQTGFQPDVARRQLQRLRDGDPSHPVVAMRSGKPVRVTGMRMRGVLSPGPVAVEGRITDVTPVRVGTGDEMRHTFMVRVEPAEGSPQFLRLERDASVRPVTARPTGTPAQGQHRQSVAPILDAAPPAPSSAAADEQPAPARPGPARPAPSRPAAEAGQAPRERKPQAAVPPAEVAEVKPSLAAGDPVPEFTITDDAIAYVVGDDPRDLASAVSDYGNPLLTSGERAMAYSRLTAMGNPPAVLDGATVLAMARGSEGFMDLELAREQLQRLRDADPTHPIVAMRSGEEVTVTGIRRGVTLSRDPVTVTGRITHVTAVRIGNGSLNANRNELMARVETEDGRDHYILLDREATVQPVETAAPAAPAAPKAARPGRRRTITDDDKREMFRNAAASLSDAELELDLEINADALAGGTPGTVSHELEQMRGEALRAEAAERGLGVPRPPAAEPAAGEAPAPQETGPEEIELAPEDVAEIEAIGDDAFGLYEAPDGELEVTEDVAERQDRVETLLQRAEAGEYDPANESTEDLTSARSDVAEELRLQTELLRRDRARRVERQRQQEQEASTAVGEPEPSDVAAGAGSGGPAEEGGELAEQGVSGELPEPTPAAPRTRPGLAGAAEDYADALRAGDADAVERTRARLESSLRRSKSDSTNVEALRRYISDTDAAEHDPDRIVDLVAAVREELRQRRNEQARRRRTARRLERERLRSLLGQIDAELRSRNLKPDDYGGDVSALVREIAAEAAAAVPTPVG